MHLPIDVATQRRATGRATLRVAGRGTGRTRRALVALAVLPVILVSVGTAAGPAAASTAAVTAPTTVAGRGVPAAVGAVATHWYLPQLTLDKALDGPRAADTDEFTVQIHTGSAAGPVVNATTSSTTTGAGSTVDAGTGTTGPFVGVSGTTYFLDEAAAGSADLSRYDATVSCTDSAGVQSGLPTDAPLDGALAITPVQAARISCTITNVARNTEPGLALVKSASISTDGNGDGLAGVGDRITFSFAVHNTGAVTLGGVTVADQLVAPAGPSVSVWCPRTTLAPDERMVCTSSAYVVTQADVDAGSVANAATAQGSPPYGPPVVTEPSQTSTPTPSGPGLALVKSASISTDGNGDGLAGVGDRVTFSFAVHNTGAVTLGGVTVADQLVAPAGPSVSVWCPRTTLAPDERMVCTSSAYVVTQADVDAGSVANAATAQGSPPYGPPVVTEPSQTSTPTPGPGIRVVKTAHLKDADRDGLADAGESIDYGFVVTNTGATTLRDIDVDDPNLEAIGVHVKCPSPTLSPGQQMVCTAPPYLVTQADIDAGKVRNVATAEGRTPPGKTVVSPASTADTSTAPRGDGHGDGDGLLAATGSDVRAPLALGVFLVVIGLLLVAAAGRRRRGRDGATT